MDFRPQIGLPSRWSFRSFRVLGGIKVHPTNSPFAALVTTSKPRSLFSLKAVLVKSSPSLGAVASYAQLLFDFSPRREVVSYTQPMSQVLRWWRGQLTAACAWPVAPTTTGLQCCGGCMRRAALAGRLG